MRTGHGTVGQLVSKCENAGCRLKDLSLEDLQQVCDLIEADVYDVLGAENAMKALQSFGSGGEARVAERIAYWQETVG